jgi:hypothetical protein
MLDRGEATFIPDSSGPARVPISRGGASPTSFPEACPPIGPRPGRLGEASFLVGGALHGRGYGRYHVVREDR